jgi:hypothetical protein
LLAEPRDYLPIWFAVVEHFVEVVTYESGKAGDFTLAMVHKTVSE